MNHICGMWVWSTSELPDNIILLFQPPHCPEVNPTERVWEYIKEFLAWLVLSNLDELRVKVKEILASLTNHVIGFLTGWSWILHSLSLAHLWKNGISLRRYRSLVLPIPIWRSTFADFCELGTPEAKNRGIWRKLRLVVVHSTKLYIPLSANKSPLNLGLQPFNSEQV